MILQQEKANDMKQTAVEWLWTRLSLIIPDGFEDEFEAAKEMEKEQIIEAYSSFGDLKPFQKNNGSWEMLNAEEYYNETYGK